MKFSNPETVANVVYSLRQAEFDRSTNRSLINDLFNGSPPWTEAEADADHIGTNVNDLSASRIAHDARNTFNNAYLKPGNFFNVTLDSGPVMKRDTWGRIITKSISKPMKRSAAYRDTLRSEFAQTVLHGVGPSLWTKGDAWCPGSISISDLLIPSRTLCSLENLEFFAVFRQYTPSKLYSMTHGKNVDHGWNMKTVNAILKKYADEHLTTGSATSYFQNPERMVEMIKEDGGLYDNDEIPTVNCWDFFFLNDKADEPEWHRCMILDDESGPKMGESFLYQTKRVIAKDLSQILHVMFGDGANVAPFRYHSVRGLGWLLYAVCHLQNRLMCKFNDAVFEQLMWYWRVNSPEDYERANKIDMHHLGIIPDGMNFVLGSERYTPNAQLISQAFAMNRQSMSESSSQFRADIDNGTSKEMTAQEVMARMNSANAMVGGVLNLSYELQLPQYREICRRFCNKDSNDPDVKQFREDVLKQGVPKEMLDVDRWNIVIDRVLGNGNKTLEIAQAKEMMGARALYDPEPQRKILHIFTEALLDNAQLAEELVPIGEKEISDDIHDAQLVAASLMLGLPVSVKTGMNHIEYIEALLVSMGQVITRIQQTGNMTDQKELMGLQNVAAHIGKHIKILDQDNNEKERVKRYQDVLGKFGNLIKAFAQRLAESEGSGQGSDITPEAQAKIQSSQMLAESAISLKEQKAAQQIAQKTKSFAAQQVRDDITHAATLEREKRKAEADVASKDIKTAAEVRAKQIKTESKPEPE